jgi:hypothetical protein
MQSIVCVLTVYNAEDFLDCIQYRTRHVANLNCWTAAPKAPADPAEVSRLEAAIAVQGELVRKLKADDGDANEIKAQVRWRWICSDEIDELRLLIGSCSHQESQCPDNFLLDIGTLDVTSYQCPNAPIIFYWILGLVM